VRESSQQEKSDQSGECATDFAEQQFARVLAQQGGLGLASLIARGLTHPPSDNRDPI
jgi:Rod binding domain-containing protein